MLLEGRELKITSPAGAIAEGIGLVPEDRKHQGLVQLMSVRENIPLIPVRQTFLRNHRLSQLIAADGIHLTMGGYEQLFDTLADWVKHNI